MDSRLRQILDELYAIEPSLREKEKDVTAIVTALLAHKPETPFDATFAARLRHDLLMKSAPVKASPFSLLLPRLSLAVGTFAVVALAAYTVAQPKNNTTIATDASGIFGTPKVVAMAPNAFGTLTNVGVGGGMGGGGAEARNAVAQNVVAPSATPAAAPAATTLAAESPMVDSAAGSGGGTTAKMIAPGEPYPGSWEYTQIEYAYEGDLAADLKDINSRVYRRVFTAPGAKASFLNSYLPAGMGNVWSNGDVQNVSVSDGKENGYMMFIDYVSGNLGISRNYAMMKMMPVQPNGNVVLPEADALIAAANDFLADNGVSRDGYGDPIVTDAPIMRALEISRSSIPVWQTTFQVTYPVIIDGKQVMGWDGNPTGMTVGVQTDGKGNVVGAEYFNKQLATSYEASDYELLTDTDRLQKIVSRGSIYPQYIPTDATIKKATVTLGKPEVVLSQQYDCAINTCRDLYVPTLRFPITDNAAAINGDPIYAPRFIMIPLLKSMIDTAENPAQPTPDLRAM